MCLFRTGDIFGQVQQLYLFRTEEKVMFRPQGRAWLFFIVFYIMQFLCLFLCILCTLFDINALSG